MVKIQTDRPVADLAQLGGCTVGVVFPTKGAANRAIRRLIGCPTHHGTHHFAVTGEGRTVSMSPTAVECLESRSLV